MKYLVLCLFFVGCGSDGMSVERAEQLCQERAGIRNFTPTYSSVGYVSCRDGTIFNGVK